MRDGWGFVTSQNGRFCEVYLIFDVQVLLEESLGALEDRIYHFLRNAMVFDIEKADCGAGVPQLRNQFLFRGCERNDGNLVEVGLSSNVREQWASPAGERGKGGHGQ